MAKLLIWFNPEDDLYKLGSYSDYVIEVERTAKTVELDILYELDPTVSKLAKKIIKQLNGGKIVITT
ncbi:MAG: hypothetical protein AAGA85_06490 [Bacteroidota bacterium]